MCASCNCPSASCSRVFKRKERSVTPATARPPRFVLLIYSGSPAEGGCSNAALRELPGDAPLYGPYIIYQGWMGPPLASVYKRVGRDPLYCGLIHTARCGLHAEPFCNAPVLRTVFNRGALMSVPAAKFVYRDNLR